MSCFTKLLILTVYVFYLQSVQVITTSDYSTSVYQVETSSFNNSLREDSSNGTTYISFPANTSVYVSPNYDILGELIADTNQTSVPIGLQITVGTYFNNFSDIPEIQTTGVPAMVTLMTGTKVAIFIDTRIWKHIQFVTSLVGFALNLLAFGVFVIHGKFFTKTLRILLSHQVSDRVSECVSVCVWVSEWVIETVNERVIERVNEWVSEWPSEWVCQCVNEWVSEWLSEWMSEWVSVRVGEWVREWVIERVNEWVSEWLSEWVSG